MSPELLAQACSEGMHARDYAAQLLGINILESQPGQAKLSMTIRPDMLNGHAVCHGGMLFTLADTAFAHACNNTNKLTLASGCSIDFRQSAKQGDTLIASAKEQSRSGRTGIYDVEIHNQEGVLVALFRGRSYQLNGTVIEEAAA